MRTDFLLRWHQEKCMILPLIGRKPTQGDTKMDWEPICTIIVTLSAVLSGVISWIVAGQRLKWEFGLDIATLRAIQKLLDHPKWDKRSFGEIKKRIGGLENDQLRRFLVAAGAVRFQLKGKSSSLDTDDELWGLLKKNK